MYLDTAYIVKFYLNEPDAEAVREVIHEARHRCSSAWAIPEVTSVFNRHIQQGWLPRDLGHEFMDLFRHHVDQGFWAVIPITETLLRKTAHLIRGLPRTLPLRAGDALHLATALDAAEPEIWTNDRHLLAAAPHVGIRGRCVS